MEKKINDQSDSMPTTIFTVNHWTESFSEFLILGVLLVGNVTNGVLFYLFTFLKHNQQGGIQRNTEIQNVSCKR